MERSGPGAAWTALPLYGFTRAAPRGSPADVAIPPRCRGFKHHCSPSLLPREAPIASPTTPRRRPVARAKPMDRHHAPYATGSPRGCRL